MLRRRLAAQLGRPRGPFGRVVTAMLNRGNRATNERVIELLDVDPSSQRVLDVGFGGGVGLELLGARSLSLVAGVDHSEDAVRAARKRFRGAQLEVGSVEALPFEDGSFDRVMSVHTIYFWPDPEAGARELFRVTAPGGRVVLAFARGEYMRKQKIHQHGFAFFEAGDVAALLTGAGFAPVRVEGDGPLFAVAEKPGLARAEDEAALRELR